METKSKEQTGNQNIEENNEQYNEISNTALFIKAGILVLSIIMIIGFSIKILPDAVTVSNISTKNELPIYCVNTNQRQVALSFDTAWKNDDIQKLLDILEKYNISATFFMTGEWVSNYPDETKAIAAAGHDLGNHSSHHKYMTRMSKEECIEEISGVHDKVKDITGIEMTLFRAPYGDYNNTLIEAARECGYDTIQWNVDSLDWKDYGVDSILNMVVENKHLGNGSIILMHSGAKYTSEALELVITGLKDKEFEIVPVSQLIYNGDYSVDETGKQFDN